VVGVAEPLCGHVHGFSPVVLRASLGNPASDDVHIGFLAGLEDAEILVHRPEIGDHPVGTRFGPMLGTRPAGPAVTLGRSVGGGVDGEHAVAEVSGEIGRFHWRQVSR